MADHRKMLQLLQEKLDGISGIQKQVRAELKKNPLVIDALIPKGEPSAEKKDPAPVTRVPEKESTVDFSKEQKEVEQILTSLKDVKDTQTTTN